MGSLSFQASGLTFSEALREGTRELHAQAERSGVIFDILRKRASREGYILFLRNLLPIYREMETVLDGLSGASPAKLFARADLYRTNALARDLARLAGETWVDALPVLPEAESYAATVAAAGRGEGSKVLAHAYVRYFGDLSGGQALKGLIGRTLGLSSDQLGFYEFPSIRDPQEFKNTLRQRLDEIVPQLEDPTAIIEEARTAFRFNIEVSNAVADAVGR